MTVMMVTHERGLAERMRGRMVFLADGKLADRGLGRSEDGDGRPGMKSQDLIELAARNLRESVLRNSLTTIGISVGVASLVSMLSLGIGLQQLASPAIGENGVVRHHDCHSRAGIGRGLHAPWAGRRMPIPKPKTPAAR